MQEARIIFLDCVRRYAQRVDNPAWFMALYQRSLWGRFCDLANSDTKYRKGNMLMCDVLADDQTDLDSVGELANAGELATKMRQAPNEIKSLLALLLNLPIELLADLGVSFPDMRRQGHMAQASRKLHRMLTPQKLDQLLKEMKTHLE